LQWIKQGVIEAQTIGNLPTLRLEVEMAFTLLAVFVVRSTAIAFSVRSVTVMSGIGAPPFAEAMKNAHVSATTITRRIKRLLVSAALEATESWRRKVNRQRLG
jgi:hypothetical protein